MKLEKILVALDGSGFEAPLETLPGHTELATAGGA
jgi:hypothetical protein